MNDKQELIDILNDLLKEEGLYEEDVIFINSQIYLLQNEELSENGINAISNAVEQYFGFDEEELEGDFEEETMAEGCKKKVEEEDDEEDMEDTENDDEDEDSEDEEDMEESFDDKLFNALLEAFTKKIVGGKLRKVHKGYMKDGKKITAQQLRKRSRAIRKAKRGKVVSAATKKKREKSRIKNARKFKSFFSQKKAKRKK